MSAGAPKMAFVLHRVGALAAVLITSGCVEGSRTSVPGVVGTANAGSMDGRKIFFGRCTRCHTADPLERHTVGEWRRIVDEMAGRTRLSPEERTALLSYIEQEKSSVPAGGGG